MRGLHGRILNYFRIAISGMMIVGFFFMSGCSGCSAWKERREEQHPLMKRARAEREKEHIERAVSLYQQALDRYPNIARAHLELGLLYDKYKEDYVRAYYHFQRYLEMRPDTDKRQLIEEALRGSRLSFAAELPEKPPGALEEIAELKRENEALRFKIEELLGMLEGKAVDAEPVPAVESPQVKDEVVEVTAHEPVVEPPPPVSAKSAVRRYRVQRGDTLSRIASKMYDDATQWKKIFEANRDVMDRPESLRVGQELVIP